jgi:hypothetical protein
VTTLPFNLISTTSLSSPDLSFVVCPPPGLGTSFHHSNFSFSFVFIYNEDVCDNRNGDVKNDTNSNTKDFNAYAMKKRQGQGLLHDANTDDVYIPTMAARQPGPPFEQRTCALHKTTCMPHADDISVAQS